MMTQYEKMMLMLISKNGLIRTSDVLRLGIAKTTFYAFVEANELQKAGHGIYYAPDAWIDSMYIIHLRCNQGVFSHDTALLLHDLTDREPAEYSLTVKTGYNPARLKADGVRVYTVKSERIDLGRAVAKTPFGNIVPVYNMERTICDLIRSRSKIEIQTLQTALKQYVKRRDKNLRVLMEYAHEFKVERIIRQYLEVIL